MSNSSIPTEVSNTTAPAAESGPLLSPAMLQRLERLELISRKIFRGRMKGERISRRKGQSVEFADFRNYVPGDDLRLIDWNLYARLDQLFLKLFQEEEDLHFYALIDSSASMNFGTPNKLRVAKQLAAALGYIGLCRGDRVSVQELGPRGRNAPVVRSRGSLWKMLKYLETVQSPRAVVSSEDRSVNDTGGSNVSLHDGVKDFVTRGVTSGVVVLITDLMDKTGYESALRMLIGRQMDVFVLQVLSQEELKPPLRGDRRLIDVEDGDAAEITVNQFVLDRYEETLKAFLQQARHYCAKRSIVHVLVPTDTPIETVMTKYLRSRGIVR
ncbi:DUF58 domain-containing protein [Neorhodopirellula pilleata]|uniref:DUF58 domain-containing protein n=1 Tax=Neorhodopirellula pilleata TaxID=2714738 RepID=A0A5C6A7K4_9BACT|nr:DUF58 domain-containing protein [Neorhodopirellula pilleata]TWT95061.1 hypothetical protein Pla100_36420 [Neorhodopirellula pilleata]